MNNLRRMSDASLRNSAKWLRIVSDKEFLEKESIKSEGELFTKNTIFSKLVRGSIRNDSCPMTGSKILSLSRWI